MRSKKPRARRGEVLERVMEREEFERAFKAMFGTGPRAADWEVVKAMGATARVGAEYVWDHWLGEEGGKAGLRQVEDKFVLAINEGL